MFAVKYSFRMQQRQAASASETLCSHSKWDNSDANVLDTQLPGLTSGRKLQHVNFLACLSGRFPYEIAIIE